MSAAPDIDPKQFNAMTRLDHNRALAQLAGRIGRHHSDISRMVVWGNHSATQYPDIRFCEVGGRTVAGDVDTDWYRENFIPTVQQRGAAIIKARGASSAASAASAAIDHMRSWALGTPEGNWVSMAVPADGSYGIEPGIIYSFPCTCRDGRFEIVQGLEIDAFSRERMSATETELREALADYVGVGAEYIMTGAGADEIIDLLIDYQQKHNSSVRLVLGTNFFGHQVHRVLQRLPAAIHVKSTLKTSPVNWLKWTL